MTFKFKWASKKSAIFWIDFVWAVVIIRDYFVIVIVQIPRVYVLKKFCACLHGKWANDCEMWVNAFSCLHLPWIQSQQGIFGVGSTEYFRLRSKRALACTYFLRMYHAFHSNKHRYTNQKLNSWHHIHTWTTLNAPCVHERSESTCVSYIMCYALCQAKSHVYVQL